MSLFTRSSGILLHPTSLPGRYGIGDLGDSAFRFVDWLADQAQGAWQCCCRPDQLRRLALPDSFSVRQSQTRSA